MALRWRHGDGAAFKVLLILLSVYGIMSFVAYTVIYMRHVTPLAADAPLDRFSETRAIEHIRRLAAEDRQVGRKGHDAAARYIKAELDALAVRAGPEFRVVVEETLVSGAFNMTFLRHRISLGYRNIKNIVFRISSNSSTDEEASVLLNGHFDSPLGSPGAADCGSCVASMLELARVMVDSSWIPARPIIFLFNGAEELYLLGSHGFVKTNKWSDTVGAFINIEASGSGGLDLVCQSGPGSWPALAYAESAKYPMANSVAQDVFSIIPGDTDYRTFAKDLSNIPGLDIIFVLGGSLYHTSHDTVERIFPGSIQARGENLLNLIDTLSRSSMVLNSKQRSSEVAVNGTEKDDQLIYFDYLSWFMVYYPRKLSLVLHNVPIITFVLMPLFLCSPKQLGLSTWLSIFSELMKGMLFHVIGIVLAIVIPVLFAVIGLLFSSHAMSWFAHPYLAFLMFVPCSIVGLLIPRTMSGFFPKSQDGSRKALSDEAYFWGAYGLYGLFTTGYLLAGLGGGFLTFFIAASMVLAWLSFSLTSKHFGNQSLMSLAGYVIPLLPCLLYAVYFSGFFVMFLIEKMGMIGSPLPYGFFIPDILVAAVIGVVTGWCFGPLVPVASRWLARGSVVQCLVHISVLALALSSQVFPYSTDAPKRVGLQHTFVTTDSSTVRESSYEFSVVDANSLAYLFKYAPEAEKLLGIGSEFSLHSAEPSISSSWSAIYPVAMLFSDSLKFPAQSDAIFKHYKYVPQLLVREPASVSKLGVRRINLELYLGSLEEIWVTTVNVTGPLSNWSLADNVLPDPQNIKDGPPSYICRLSGSSHENWKFWLEANSSEPLRVDIAVLDQYVVDDTKKLKSLFPNWADVNAYSAFLSSYQF